jgi:hypothetical protein
LKITTVVQAFVFDQVKCCGYRLAVSLVVINNIPDISLFKAPASAKARVSTTGTNSNVTQICVHCNVYLTLATRHVRSLSTALAGPLADSA